jgi:hypothetical protein
MNLGNGAPNGRFDALDWSHSVTEFNVINSLEGPTLGSSFKTLPATLPERVKQKSGFGRVPLDIAPISDDHRCYRQSRLRPVTNEPRPKDSVPRKQYRGLCILGRV